MEKSVGMKRTPVILKKSNFAFIKQVQNMTKLKPNLKIQSLFKDDVLYDTRDVCFLKGEYQRLLLVNRLNIVTKFIKTIAKYFSSDGTVLEKTSERVSSLIGQENYKTVFSGLCSIIDQNLKIRSILALLTTEGVVKSEEYIKPEVIEKCCQTDEMRIQFKKPRRRIRKKLSPYIVKDVPDAKRIRKIIVDIPLNESNSIEKQEITICDIKIENQSTENKSYTSNEEEVKSSNITGKKLSSNDSLPDIGHLHDENSNSSIGNFSSFSIETSPELLVDPMSLLVDKHTKDNIKVFTLNTNPALLRVMDGNKLIELVLPYKPEDELHIATKDNLQYFDERTRQLLIKHQMGIDLKYCLTVDEDDNLPIHLAVLNNDLELIRRQCIVLKLKNRNVDIPANGLTPLKLSLFQELSSSTALLLQFGADVLRSDVDHKTSVHLAAELNTDHLKVLMQHCRNNARRILMESDLWKPDMGDKSDEELTQFLLHRICTLADKQGYIPLMLASMLGLYDNVRQLLEQVPSTVNYQMPTSGNTALYLACEAACNSGAGRGNKSKVEDHFQKTIEILIENGADPAIDNYSNSNVNTLLAEFNCQTLSLLIYNRVTKYNFKKNSIPLDAADYFDRLMVVKTEKGVTYLKSLKNEKAKAKKEPVTILEDVVIKSPASDVQSPISESTKNPDTIAKSAEPKTDKNNVKKIIIFPDLKRKMASPVKSIKIAKVQK